MNAVRARRGLPAFPESESDRLRFFPGEPSDLSSLSSLSSLSLSSDAMSSSSSSDTCSSSLSKCSLIASSLTASRLWSALGECSVSVGEEENETIKKPYLNDKVL